MPDPIFDSPLDEAMHNAMEQARGTFGYFWRELHWEHRRIVPALSMAAAKVAFADPEDEQSVEQMWINDLHFDGHSLFGTLLNEPRDLTHVKAGDAVQVPLERVSDWLVAMGSEVFGGFTIQQIRRGMNPEERAQHDAAWGLDFGDPDTVTLPHEGEEHPMSENMGPALAEHLAANPETLTAADPHGATFLHQMALGGSLACVMVLIDAGADPTAETVHGDTPRDLAIRMGWERVADRLS